MKAILRRLARLEAEAPNAPAQGADQGFSPEEYARAHAELTRLLSTHPTRWTPEELDVMSGLFPQVDFKSAMDRQFAEAEGA